MTHLFLLVLLFLQLFSGNDGHGQSNDKLDDNLIINDVTQSTLHQVLSENKVVLLNFYAPWCGYCVSLYNELSIAATDIERLGLDARIGTVDATKNRDFALGEGLDGYPSLILYRNGVKMARFNGERTAKHIFDFIKEKSGPKALVVHSQEEYIHLVHEIHDGLSEHKYKSFHLVLCLIHGELELDDPSSIASLYSTAVEMHEGVKYIFTNAYDIMNTYEIKADTMLFLTFRDGEKDAVTEEKFKGIENIPSIVGEISISKEMSSDEISRLILSHTIPTMITFGSDTKGIINSLPIREHVLLFVNEESLSIYNGKRKMESSESENTQLSVLLLKEAELLSSKYRGRLIFIIIPSTEQAVLQYFGFRSIDLPQTVVADIRESDAPKRYDMKGGNIESYQNGFNHAFIDTSLVGDLPQLPLVNAINLNNFLDHYVTGNIYETLRSESLEKSTTGSDKSKKTQQQKASKSLQVAKGNSGFVETIVASQFKENVLLRDINVMVMFFAPWCAHCKSFEPLYLDASDGLKNDASVAFVRIDATKNDIEHPRVRIEGYPTIYLFPRGEKDEPIEFDGMRSTENIIQFVQSSGGSTLANHTGMKVNDIIEEEL